MRSYNKVKENSVTEKFNSQVGGFFSSSFAVSLEKEPVGLSTDRLKHIDAPYVGDRATYEAFA